MTELTYKKPRRMNQESVHSQELQLPSIAEIQKAQQEQLVELARVRFGFNDDQFNLLFTPLNIDVNQSEQQILRLIMQVPASERCDQILYAIASKKINPQIANNLISAIGILERLSQIQALENK
jgi:hypothetical protein